MKLSILRASVLTSIVTMALAVAPAFAQNVAVVNGKPIPKARADEIITQLVRSGQKDTPQLDAAVRDKLIEREVLLQEADRRALAKDPQVQEEIELSRQQVLISALAQDYFKANPPTEAEMRARYDEVVKTMSTKEYHVHHILVDTESQARAIIAKLKGGASFEELAKQSKDTGSATRGGDLDWAPATNYVQPFADAVVKLQKGHYTLTPVKTQFGYHVIRLDDVRDRKIPTFEEAKPQLAAMVSQDQHWREAKFKAMLADLRAKAKVE